MATKYSNKLAEARKANPRVNTTQRSWSDYQGNKPIRGWVGTDAYKDSWKNSASVSQGGWIDKQPNDEGMTTSMNGAAASEAPPPSLRDRWNRMQKEESEWEKMQRESRLRKAMQNIAPLTTDPNINPVV